MVTCYQHNISSSDTLTSIRYDTCRNSQFWNPPITLQYQRSGNKMKLLTVGCMSPPKSEISFYEFNDRKWRVNPCSKSSLKI